MKAINPSDMLADMSIDTNTNPRVQIGLQSARPATPSEDGLIYGSEQGISIWERFANSGAGGWVFTPGFSGTAGIQVGHFNLVTGIHTVSNVTITASSLIFISLKSQGGTIAAAPSYAQSSIVSGIGTGSFQISSVSITGAVNNADTSTLNYLIIG